MPASITPSTSNRIESFRLPAEAGTSVPGATATAGTSGTAGAAGTAGSTGSAAGVVAPTLERPHNAPSSRTSAPLASSSGEELRERRPLPELVSLAGAVDWVCSYLPFGLGPAFALGRALRARVGFAESPDCTQLAYERQKGTQHDIWVVNLLNGATTPVVTNSVDDTTPSWSR